jgi:hypothetical protein
MQIGISLPTEEFRAAIQANSSRLRNAAYKALNKTAQDVQQALQAEMKRVFYKPTPYVLNSTSIKWARRDDLVAEVGFRERAGNIRGGSPQEMIGTQVYGGTRAQKRSEIRIQGLRPGGAPLYMMPARFAQYDANGNPSRGELTQIMSQLNVLLRGDNRAARRGKRTRKSRTEYFAIFGRGEGTDLSGNALAPGIYRKNAAGRPMPVYFFMKDAPRYRKRLNWHEVARATTVAKMQANFQAEAGAAVAPRP